MADRGRLSPAIHAAYQKLHGAPPEPETQGRCVASCGKCGRKWMGLAEAHCPTCHRHFSTVSNFDKHRPNGLCVEPLALEDRHGVKKFKIHHGPWGDVYVGGKERPDLESEGMLL